MNKSFLSIGLILAFLLVLVAGCGVLPPAETTPGSKDANIDLATGGPKATLEPGAPTPTIDNPTGYNLNPCSLLTSANIATVIAKSNPPRSGSGVDPATNVTSKKCDYISQKGDAMIKVRVQEDPQVPALSAEQIASMKATEGYLESNANGATIYLVGKAGDAPGFTAYLLKGNIGVLVTATGRDYKYESAKVVALLTQVALKLP